MDVFAILSPEIRGRIVDAGQGDPNFLYACALLSRALHDPVREQIFTSVNLRSFNRTSELLQLVEGNKDIAAIIRTIVIKPTHAIMLAESFRKLLRHITHAAPGAPLRIVADYMPGDLNVATTPPCDPKLSENVAPFLRRLVQLRLSNILAIPHHVRRALEWLHLHHLTFEFDSAHAPRTADFFFRNSELSYVESKIGSFVRDQPTISFECAVYYHTMDGDGQLIQSVLDISGDTLINFKERTLFRPTYVPGNTSIYDLYNSHKLRTLELHARSFDNTAHDNSLAHLCNILRTVNLKHNSIEYIKLFMQIDLETKEVTDDGRTRLTVTTRPALLDRPAEWKQLFSLITAISSGRKLSLFIEVEGNVKVNHPDIYPQRLGDTDRDNLIDTVMEFLQVHGSNYFKDTQVQFEAYSVMSVSGDGHQADLRSGFASEDVSEDDSPGLVVYQRADLDTSTSDYSVTEFEEGYFSTRLRKDTDDESYTSDGTIAGA